MGRRVIDGPDRSRFLIDVPTGILIGCRSKDITPAIGSVNSPTFTGTSLSTSSFTMSNVFTSIFNNNAHAEGVRSLRAAHQAAAHREVTPFDFNISRYQVSPSSDVMS